MHQQVIQNPSVPITPAVVLRVSTANSVEMLKNIAKCARRRGTPSKYRASQTPVLKPNASHVTPMKIAACIATNTRTPRNFPESKSQRGVGLASKTLVVLGSRKLGRNPAVQISAKHPRCVGKPAGENQIDVPDSFHARTCQRHANRAKEQSQFATGDVDARFRKLLWIEFPRFALGNVTRGFPFLTRQAGPIAGDSDRKAQKAGHERDAE